MIGIIKLFGSGGVELGSQRAMLNVRPVSGWGLMHGEVDLENTAIFRIERAYSGPVYYRYQVDAYETQNMGGKWFDLRPGDTFSLEVAIT